MSIRVIAGGVLIFASLVVPSFDRTKDDLDLYEKQKEVIELDVELPKQEVNQLNEPVNGGATDNDICNIAKLVWAEAGSQSEYGKRLVIDTILNRVDSSAFPNSIDGVIFQKGYSQKLGRYVCQFSPMSDGSFNKAPIQPDILVLIEEELENRTDYNVIYFRTKHYHSCGHPYLIEGAHYFSTL